MPTTGNNQNWTDFYGARWSYERLLFLQPHVPVGGLWQKDQLFFVVCPGLEAGWLTHDGQPLEAWWHNSGRAAGVPMQLVSSPPEGAIRLPERTVKELAESRGTPLSISQVETLLAISLPFGFPEFNFETSPPVAFLYVASPLTRAQERLLNQCFEPLRANLRLTVKVDSVRCRKTIPSLPSGATLRPAWMMRDPLSLVTSKHLLGFTAQVKDAVGEDEDFWIRNRVKVFAGDISNPEQLVPEAFRSNVSRCLVNAAVFPPGNLRTYLSLYHTILMVMPLDDRYSDALAAMRVNEDDIVDLASRGRIQFVLPQSIRRYSRQLLSRLGELPTKPLLLSRRLAALTICDCRKRIPFLYPTFDVAERRLVLETFLAIAKHARLDVATAVAMELGRIWSSAEDLIQFRGAMATGAQGLGGLLVAMIKASRGGEPFIEMYHAAGSVEWAAALKASVFPVQTGDYSEEGAVRLCASAYSGISDKVRSLTDGTEIVVKSLLALDDDAPVLDVADSFSGADTDRLSALVLGAVRSSSTAEEMNELIRRMNDRVRRFDALAARQVRVDLIGLAGVLATAIASKIWQNPALQYTGLGAWILKYAFQNAEPKSASTRRILDLLRATNAWTKSDVVLVSRLRKKINP